MPFYVYIKGLYVLDEFFSGDREGFRVLFEDVKPHTSDVLFKIRAPVDLADVKVENFTISGGQGGPELIRIMADEAPLARVEEIQSGQRPVDSVVDAHLNKQMFKLLFFVHFIVARSYCSPSSR